MVIRSCVAKKGPRKPHTELTGLSLLAPVAPKISLRSNRVTLCVCKMRPLTRCSPAGSIIVSRAKHVRDSLTPARGAKGLTSGGNNVFASHARGSLATH